MQQLRDPVAFQEVERGSERGADMNAQAVTHGVGAETQQLAQEHQPMKNTGKSFGETVLIVDDSPENLLLLSRYLHQSGYRILTAEDGPSALIQARGAKPDLVLLDVMMPGLDGFATCRSLKQDAATQNIPVIFLTALTDTESKLEGFQAGGVDYVPKPFERREVLARIQTHLELRRLQKRLEAQIAEQEQLQEALRQYTTSLEERNNDLKAFAHTVAHDLKNPLGSLVGIAEILEKDYAGFSHQAVEDLLSSIVRSGRKANNIVEELLILAGVHDQRIKAGPIKMGDIVHEAQYRLIDMIDATQAEIFVPNEWPVALGYAPWIEEVWVNYLSNGIKYGGQPPQLKLGATLQSKKIVRFWIKDNGTGLEPEEQAKLFMPFQRLDKVRIEGHGLGLSIVRRIVEKLGGEVGVESAGIPGQGSVFFFTLPRA